MAQPSSKKLVAIGLVLVVAIAATSFWLLPRRSKLPEDRETRLAISMMSNDLRGLMVAEEATRRIRGRYVPDAEDAGQLSSVGVTKPRIVLSDTGYTAIVEHKNVPGIQCAVGVYARNPLTRFAKNFEVVCK